MESRIDKYKDKEYKPSRVEKNKDLYKMIYSAYDEFENYKVPLEEKEIDLSKMNKNITSRNDYRVAKKYGEVTNSSIVSNNFSEEENYKKEKEVYDIKELLNKVKNDDSDDRKTSISEEKYLDKLHLKNNEKTNLQAIKEKYEEIILDSEEEEKLSNTANLSLEILSDLKSNEDTVVSPPMKDDEDTIVTDSEEVKKKNIVEKDESFYSDTYNFNDDDFDDDDELEEGNNKFLFKILIILSIIILIALIIVYLVGYFGK